MGGGALAIEVPEGFVAGAGEGLQGAVDLVVTEVVSAEGGVRGDSGVEVLGEDSGICCD